MESNNVAEVRIPKSMSDLGIKYFKSLLKLDEIQDKDFVTTQERIMVNSMFSDWTEGQLMQASSQSNNELYSKVMRMLDTFRPKAIPPKKIRIKGKNYVLVEDFTKMPTGWFVDISRFDFNEEPARMAAVCYLEEGMGYAEKDRYNNIINLSGDRMEIFNDYFPLDDFINLTGFFLKVYVVWMESLTPTEKRNPTIRKMREDLERLSGRRRSMRYRKSSESDGMKS